MDATVVDVLPADVTLACAQFAALPAGVVCGGPVGRTITCTIPKGLLEVADPPVLITTNVVIPTTPGTIPVINKVIVTSPDDEAPCTVTTTNISCNPSDTNNYDDVVVGFTGLTIVKDAQPNTGTPFQFTVSGGGQPASFSLVDDGSNTNNTEGADERHGRSGVHDHGDPADRRELRTEQHQLHRRRDGFDRDRHGAGDGHVGRR